ncbi:hypothetical protein K470DRAFT_257680 [Piedraia hortae CBS 480.64]|uniref:Uncharacterized protein n=1 Tax=Piedraia hortae CBS 480.64 TaxID=1314780 RepID=A0A6A7C1V3_9PEZI|nr:hypothetical protein K470DRAFT_257680 [Piedraia hortae CBS 480.64]
MDNDSSTWTGEWAESDVSLFAPNNLPMSKVRRGWERTPSNPLVPNKFRAAKIWKRTPVPLTAPTPTLIFAKPIKKLRTAGAIGLPSQWEAEAKSPARKHISGRVNLSSASFEHTASGIEYCPLPEGFVSPPLHAQKHLKKPAEHQSPSRRRSLPPDFSLPTAEFDLGQIAALPEPLAVEESGNVDLANAFKGVKSFLTHLKLPKTSLIDDIEDEPSHPQGFPSPAARQDSVPNTPTGRAQLLRFTPVHSDLGSITAINSPTDDKPLTETELLHSSKEMKLKLPRSPPASASRRESVLNRRDSDRVRQALAHSTEGDVTAVLGDLDPNSSTLHTALTSPSPVVPTTNASTPAARKTTRSGRVSRPTQTISVPSQLAGPRVELKRSEVQQLAIDTRFNTKKNKNGAVMPQIRLAQMNSSATASSSVTPEADAKKTTGRGVQWAETLVAFSEEGAPTQPKQPLGELKSCLRVRQYDHIEAEVPVKRPTLNLGKPRRGGPKAAAKKKSDENAEEKKVEGKKGGNKKTDEVGKAEEKKGGSAKSEEKKGGVAKAADKTEPVKPKQPSRMPIPSKLPSLVSTRANRACENKDKENARPTPSKKPGTVTPKLDGIPELKPPTRSTSSLLTRTRAGSVQHDAKTPGIASPAKRRGKTTNVAR